MFPPYFEGSKNPGFCSQACASGTHSSRLIDDKGSTYVCTLGEWNRRLRRPLVWELTSFWENANLFERKTQLKDTHGTPCYKPWGVEELFLQIEIVRIHFFKPLFWQKPFYSLVLSLHFCFGKRVEFCIYYHKISIYHRLRMLRKSSRLTDPFVCFMLGCWQKCLQQGIPCAVGTAQPSGRDV